jgi:hypothetical protein
VAVALSGICPPSLRCPQRPEDTRTAVSVGMRQAALQCGCHLCAAHLPVPSMLCTRALTKDLSAPA